MKARQDLKRISSLLFILLTIFSWTKSTLGANKTDYYDLHFYLFDSFYNKDVRPVEDDTESLYVFMEFELLSLVEVDEKDQKLVTNARLVLDWADEYLSWDPSDFGGIETLMVPQGKVWLPDVVVANGVVAQTRLGYDQLPVRLYSNGLVDWRPSLLLTTACDIKITYFPFDTQECNLEFETTVSFVEEVDIAIDEEDPITLFTYSEDGQWELKSTKALNLIDENGKSRVQYTIVLARRRTFYLIYIIMPIFFLSLLSSLIFALPPDEGEKVSAGITVVLAFAVYLTIVSDLVPNTSLQVSILGVYLIVLLGLSALNLIVCVFILRLHFRDNSTSVGSKTRRTVIVLRKMLSMAPFEYRSNSIGNVEGTDNPRNEASLPQSDFESSSLEEKMTWQVVAATLDWFCFLFFSSVAVIVTIACMLAMEIGSVVNAP